ncbi:unnamed protein product, partial [Meganyctiphanes norvegica]
MSKEKPDQRKISQHLLWTELKTLCEFVWSENAVKFLRYRAVGKIFVFYCLYYGFLAGFFSICMFLFYQTLDTEHEPKYAPGREDSLLKNPSMGLRPRPPAEDIESSMIYYESGDKETYKQWTSSLNELLDGTEDPKRNYVSSTGKNIVECNATTVLKDDQVCDVLVSSLGEECTKANNWGYSSDSPCIILKLNRMFGWLPKVYEEDVSKLPKDLPKQLEKHIKDEAVKNDNKVPKMLWVSCDGDNPMDSEMLTGGVKYYPSQGFPYHYFPYENQANYKSPLIAVQFIKPKQHIMINVYCKIYGNKLLYDRKTGIGMVRFELLID